MTAAGAFPSSAPLELTAEELRTALHVDTGAPLVVIAPIDVESSGRNFEVLPGW